MNKKNTKQLIQWLVTIGIALIVYFAIPRNDVITEPIARFLAITLCGVIAWIFDLLPPFITGLLMTLGYILLNVTDANTAFACWNNQIVWLTFGGVVVGVAFEKTGLLKRIAYTCIRKTGYSYTGIVIGLIISGFIVCLLLPNVSARVVLFAFLGLGICKAMKLEKETPAGAGIMIASFMAAVSGRFILPSSNDSVVLASSIMETPVTLNQHLAANALPTVIWAALMAVLVLVCFRPKEKIECKAYIDSEYEQMGKMAPAEIKFLVLLLITLVLVFTNKVGLGWAFLLLACVLFIPGIGCLEGSDIAKANIPMTIFVATAMTIGNVTTALGIGKIVADYAVGILNGMVVSKFVFYPIVWFFGVIVTMLMTPLAAAATFTVPISGIATAAGMSIPAAVYSLCMGVEQMIFPYEWAAALFVFSFGYISAKQFLKWGALRMALCLIFLLVICIPMWSMVGFA